MMNAQSHSPKITHSHHLFSILLLLCLALLCTPQSADAASYTTIDYPVTYHQTEARRMLNLINAYRRSNGKADLKYDYMLEEYAMKRASELALRYSHTRPDDTKWDSAFPTSYTTKRSWSRSENIWTSSASATADDALSVFQGSSAHNAAMLDSTYTAVGFSFATVGNHGYWVQHFHSLSSSMGATSAFNGEQTVSTRLSTNLFYLRSSEGTHSTLVSVPAGLWTALPEFTLMAGDVPVRKAEISWSSDDTSLVEVDGNNVFGKGDGSVTLSGTDVGKTFTCTVYTNRRNVWNATVKLTQDSYTYTGSPIYPSGTVSLQGNYLKPGQDYQVSWSNNTNAGEGLITVTGVGYFTGTTEVRFPINKKDQTVTASISSSSIVAGKTATITASGIGGISYYTSDSSVLRVDEKTGVVTGLAAGTGVITVATDGNDNINPASAKITVTVTAASGSSSSSGSNSGSGSSASSKASALAKAPALKTMNKRITKIKGYADPVGSTFRKLRVYAKSVTKNSVTLKWSKIKNATGYVIYGSVCNKKNNYRKIKTVSAGTTSAKITKIGGTKLKKAKHYKFIVVAMGKTKAGTKKALATGKSVHAITAGSKKYGNYKSVKLKNISNKHLYLWRGSTFTVKAAGTVPAGKKVKTHRYIQYESSKSAVAAVTKKGKITAKKAGTCYIYAYAQNGRYTRFKVTVIG